MPGDAQFRLVTDEHLRLNPLDLHPRFWAQTTLEIVWDLFFAVVNGIVLPGSFFLRGSS